MTEVPSTGSVPSVPLPQPSSKSSGWTVKSALLACLLVMGGGQLLALALLQGGLGWIHGLGAALDIGAAEKLATKSQQWLVVGIQLLVTIIEIVFAWRIARWGRANPFVALNLLPVRLGVGGWAKVIGLVMFVKFTASAIILPLSPAGAGGVAKDMAPFLELAKDTGLWLCFLAAAILAALIEEMLFRGVLSRTLEETALGFWGGAAVASALFAVVHLQYGVAGQFVVFALGLTFSWLRATTGSIWPGVVAHALNNAVALLVMKMIA